MQPSLNASNPAALLRVCHVPSDLRRELYNGSARNGTA
jgi:hypothetical protein